MTDVYLVQEANILANATDPAFVGVDRVIFEGNSLSVTGSLDLDDAYLTSGDFPFMLVLGFEGTEFDNVTDGYSDGTVYGFVGLAGLENDLTVLSTVDFPYDGAIPLELNGSTSEG